MITHVAIRFNGITYSLPAPNRHYHVLQSMVKEFGEFIYDPEDDSCEGFLDENGKFYNREEALAHALEHNQVKDINNIRLKMLFSEDLW